MADITAAIEGIDKGLKDALDKVENASRQVASAVENLDDQLEGLQSSTETTEQSLDSIDEELGGVKRGAESAEESVEGLSNEFVQAVGDVETLNLAIGGATNEINKMGASSEAVQSIVDELGSEMNETAASAAGLSGALQTTSAAQGQVAATSRTASNGLDALQGEANEATGALVGTASAAELLSLQSSALSINVGAFTVALRNLTTQVPILVATLGNLGGAFTGLAGAISAVGLGGVAIALGGMAAKAEQIAGPLEGTGNHLEALGTIADEIKPKFIEAIQPLINAEGVISFFDDTISGLAETVEVVSQSLADAFNPGKFSGVQDGVDQVQSLEETLRGIGGAILGGLEPVTNAITDMVFTLGDDIERLAAGFMSVLPTIIRSVTTTTEGMLQVFDMATQHLGGFINGVTKLGESVAAGLAPVLDIFFEIGAAVAGMLNGLGEDIDGFNGNVVATTVKIIALLAAVNRLAGVMGSLIMPLTKVTGTLGLLVSRASGPMAAFFATLSTGFGVVTDLSSGLGNLAKSFEMMLPPLGQSTSVLTAVSNKFQNSDRTIASTASSLLDFGDSADDSSASLGRFDDKLSSVRASVGKFFTKLHSAPVKPMSDITKGLDVEIDKGDALDGEDFFDGLGLNRTRKQQIQYEIETDKDIMQTGFSGVKQRLANFRDGSLIPGLHSIRSSVFDGMRDIDGAFSRGKSRIMSTLTDGPIISAFSTIRSKISSISLVDAISEPFDRVSEINVSEKLNAPFDRISQIDFAEKVNAPFRSFQSVDLDSPNFNISGMFSGVPTSINEADKATKGLINNLERVSASGFKSYITSLPGINALASTSVGDLQKSFTELAMKTPASNKEIKNFQETVRETAGQAVISKESVDDLGSEIRESAYDAGVSGDALNKLNEEVEDLSSGNITAGMTTDQLQDELIEMGASAKVAEDAVEELGDSATQYSVSAQLATIQTTLLSGATSVLSSIMAGLAISVGVLAAGFLALVAIVGTAGAVLQALGQEGKDVGDIMNILKGFLTDLAEAAMPFVMASTAAMMDVFNSLAAVASELIGAFQDIALELGLIQEPIAGGKSGMEGFMATVKAVSNSLTPLINDIGDITRIIAGRLIVAIRNGAKAFTEFLNKINAKEKLNTVKNAFQDILNAVGGLEGVMKGIISITGELISGLVKATAIIGIAATAAYVAAFGFGSLATGIWSTIAGLVALSSPISGTAAAIGAVIAAVVLALEYLGVFDVILSVLKVSFDAIMAVIMATIDVVMSLLTAIGEFLQIGEIIGFVMSVVGALADGFGILKNAVGAVISVAKSIFGIFIKLARGIINILITKGINKLVAGFNAVKNGIKNGVSALMDFLKSIPLVRKAMDRMGKGVEKVKDIFNGLKNFILNMPKIISGFFQDILKFIEDGVNGILDLVNGLIDKFNDVASKIDGVSKIDKLEEVELSQKGTLKTANKQAKTAAQNARPEDADPDSTTISQGTGGTEDSEQADTAGTNDGVTVVEGNTRNIFNQTISANPEDEVQMGRIAEDAMAEANSFKRRQEGSQ